MADATEAIRTSGYAVLEQLLSPELIAALAEEARVLSQTSAMQLAGTGVNRQHLESLRGDHIAWLAEPLEAHAQPSETPARLVQSPAQQAYWQCMQQIMTAMNQSLFMGLSSLEAHFALYPAGARYQKHLDVLQRPSPRANAMQTGQMPPVRVLSSVLYLNPDWQAEDGGALRLYLDPAEGYEQAMEAAVPDAFLDILPVGGRLVLFLSSQFYHEVLPARRERISLTGWFRQRGATPLS